MTAINLTLSPHLAAQLSQRNVYSYAVWFSNTQPVGQPTKIADGSGSTVPQTGVTVTIPQGNPGAKLYILTQSLAAGTESTLLTDIAAQGQAYINMGNAVAKDFKFDSFELTLTPSAQDQGNLTAVNGFGMPMGIVVSYSTVPATSGSRGLNISGGAVVSALGDIPGSKQLYFTEGPLSGGFLGAYSPAEAIKENIAGSYKAADWHSYVQQLEQPNDPATSPTSGIVLAGLFNGAKDANNIYHNKAFYSYGLTWDNTFKNFILTPASNSQVKGTITISESDLENSIYATNGLATISGLYDAAGNVTSRTMNTGENNQWGTVLRDFFVGFTGGYWDNLGKPLNPNGSLPSINLNKEYNQDPTYAFGNNLANTKPAYQFYDAYAKVFFDNTNSYGAGYSDALTKLYDIGPLINVSDGTGQKVDAQNIGLALYTNSDLTSGYTPQTLYNYTSAATYQPPIPSSASTPPFNNTYLTLDFTSLLGVTLAPNTPVQLNFMSAATPYGSAVVSSFNNYWITSTGAGYSTTSTFGASVPGVIKFGNLPLGAASTDPTHPDVDWYQIVIGAGSAAKTFNVYMDVVNNGGTVQILDNAFTNGGTSAVIPAALAVDGGASIVAAGAGTSGTHLQYTSAVTVTVFNGGNDTLDASLLAPVAPPTTATAGGPFFYMPSAPVVGTRPGYTAGSPTPFLEYYVPNSVQAGGGTGGTLPTSQPVTVYSTNLAFGWDGADGNAVQAQAALKNYFVSDYTNKLIAGGDVAKLTVFAGTSATGTVVSTLYATADNDGNWMSPSLNVANGGTYTVVMQEFDPTSTTAINQEGAAQTFTVAQGHVVSNLQTFNVPTNSAFDGILVESGGLLVVSGGTTNFTSLDLGGKEHVVTGTDSATIVGGEYRVWYGAAASGATVVSGGIAYNFGSEFATAVNGGGLQIIEGDGLSSTHFAIASGTIIGSGGAQHIIGSQGSATEQSATILGGGVQLVYGSSSSGGALVISSTVFSGGLEYAYSGGTIGSTTSYGTPSQTNYGPQVSGGRLWVKDPGAVISNAVLFTSGSKVYAWSGGVATNTTMQSGTESHVYGGGIDSGITVQVGAIEQVYSGGVSTNTTIYGGGLQYVFGSGSTQQAFVYGGTQDVWSNGTATSSQVEYSTKIGQPMVGVVGSQFVYLGGSAVHAIVTGGYQGVFSGGIASDTHVTSGEINSGTISASSHVGLEVVHDGGIAINTWVESGAIELVHSNGVISGATIAGGILELGHGAIIGSGTISFNGGGGTVKFAEAVTYSPLGSISGLTSGGGGGRLDFAAIPYTQGQTSLSYTSSDPGNTSGTLKITSGVLVATVSLLGSYMAANFTMESDNHGGTLVTDPPIAAADQQSLLAHPSNT